MMKVMEEIFTGTMRRFMGSGEPISNGEPTGNEGRARIIISRDATRNKNSAHPASARGPARNGD